MRTEIIVPKAENKAIQVYMESLIQTVATEYFDSKKQH